MIEILQKVVYVLAFASLGFSLVEVYLTANKLWTRKHETEVAESISVSAQLTGLVPGVIYSLNFMFERQWQGMLDQLLFLGLALLYILIAMKFWVEGERKKGLWRLFKQALKQDKQEAANLAKSFFKPSGASKILKIFAQIATIDEDLDPREKEFIQSFADNWNIHFNWEELTSNRKRGSDVNYIKLRQDLADYLATSPPENQVSQFKDTIAALVSIDEQVSEQEQLILAELNGMLSRYLDEHHHLEVYHVIIAPQNEKQSELIATTLPELSEYEVAEGTAYHCGPFYSKQYAQIVRDRYRSLNLFGVVAADSPA